MLRETQIDALARYLVSGLIARGSISPKAPQEDLVSCVIELMSQNFAIEAQIEEEADQMAEREARKNPGVDATRLRTMIKQRLAERKDFVL